MIKRYDNDLLKSHIITWLSWVAVFEFFGLPGQVPSGSTFQQQMLFWLQVQNALHVMRLSSNVTMSVRTRYITRISNFVVCLIVYFPWPRHAFQCIFPSFNSTGGDHLRFWDSRLSTVWSFGVWCIDCKFDMPWAIWHQMGILPQSSNQGTSSIHHILSNSVC